MLGARSYAKIISLHHSSPLHYVAAHTHAQSYTEFRIARGCAWSRLFLPPSQKSRIYNIVLTFQLAARYFNASLQCDFIATP
jgi:hypothetical protein